MHWYHRFLFSENASYFLLLQKYWYLFLHISWQLYNELIQPLNMLMQGTDAIKDKDFNVKFVKTGKFEMDELINVYNHMIDELRIEKTKQEEQHFFLEKLIQTSPTGIIILDFEDYVQLINPKALKLLNIEEKDMAGKTLHAINHPVIQQISQLKSGEAKTITLSGSVTFKIQKSHFLDRGFPRHFVMIEELTAEILGAEKRAYGKVIRMMAHEVNNTIGPVNSIIQSTLNTSTIWNQQESKSFQQALQIAIERNQSLNLFMRNFADVVRLPEPNKKKVDLQTKKVHFFLNRLYVPLFF